LCDCAGAYRKIFLTSSLFRNFREKTISCENITQPNNIFSQTKTCFMKRIMLSLLIISIIVASCRKDGGFSTSNASAGSGRGSGSGSPANGSPQSSSSSQPVLTGSWVSLRLTPVSTNGVNLLMGSYWFGNPIPAYYYDAEKLLYTRTPNGNSYGYCALPMSYRTINGDLHIRKEFSDRKFDVLIHYDDYTLMPANSFTGDEYRYVIVPRSVFLSTVIDWSDYATVAATLNIPL
jgi:hypothetical protein